MRIRRATKSDLPACINILIRAFAGQENWNKKNARLFLEERIRLWPSLCFCLESGKKVAGFMFCEEFTYVKGKYLWVVEFAIDPEFQGKGFGKQALEFIEGRARKNGFDVLYLAADIKENAIKVYKKFGFKKTNWLFMEKEL